MQKHNREITPSLGVVMDNPMEALLDQPHVPQESAVKIEKDKPEIKRVVKAWCDRAIRKWVLEFEDGTESSVDNAVIRKVQFSCRFISDGKRAGCGSRGEYRGFAMGTFDPLEKIPTTKGLRLFFDRITGYFVRHDTYDVIRDADKLILMDGCHSKYFTD